VSTYAGAIQLTLINDTARARGETCPFICSNTDSINWANTFLNQSPPTQTHITYLIGQHNDQRRRILDSLYNIRFSPDVGSQLHTRQVFDVLVFLVDQSRKRSSIHLCKPAELRTRVWVLYGQKLTSSSWTYIVTSSSCNRMYAHMIIKAIADNGTYEYVRIFLRVHSYSHQRKRPDLVVRMQGITYRRYVQWPCP
jgi:hypothetical protein